MTKALELERTHFIELLVMNGFVMRSFLNVSKLKELYNESVRTWLVMYYTCNCNLLICVDDSTLFPVIHSLQKFKELRAQLKSMTGFSGGSSTTIYLRHIHKLLIAIAKDHISPLYQMYMRCENVRTSY